nr:unnamed protein product [Digitaria exilis]
MATRAAGGAVEQCRKGMGRRLKMKEGDLAGGSVRRGSRSLPVDRHFFAAPSVLIAGPPVIGGLPHPLALRVSSRHRRYLSTAVPHSDAIRVASTPPSLLSPEEDQSTPPSRDGPVCCSLNLCDGHVVASGVESYDVDIKEQKVTVKGNVTPDAVLQTVSKTGKKTSFWEAETTSNQSTAPADATA